MTRPPAVLVLENGQVFTGRSFGAAVTALGEVCFNTSMSGYQEILTDPSYRQQIITFTYPMIGNYGVHPQYMESARQRLSPAVVREYVEGYSSHLGQASLSEFLVEQGRPGLEGIDTRRLVLALHREGAMRGGIFQGAYRPAQLEEVRALPAMEGLDLASDVGTRSVYAYRSHEHARTDLACIDFGVKESILHLLTEVGFNVTVFPARTPVADLAHFPAFIF